MPRKTIRSRRVLCLALALVCVGAAVPAIVLASSTTYCNPCTLGSGTKYYDSTYHSALNNIQTWDYWNDGSGNCAGDYLTSLNGFGAVQCHGPTGSGSGYNTSICTYANSCLPAATEAGHAGMENYGNSGSGWYVGWEAWN